MTYPSDNSDKLILVTGASGYVAAHVLNEFLENGYSVRGTVRSKSTADKVRKTHAKYGDKLSFAIVEDIAAPGAFNEAVKGVDGIIHTASPFQLVVEDNERDLLLPAIRGTTGILEATAKYNQNVKRIVITSSFAAIVDLSQGLRPGYTYTEKDWNPVTYEEAKVADGSAAYCASKTFAERAAFDFVKENKPLFTVSSVTPPMVYGPAAQHVESLKHLNTSSADIYRLIDGSTKEVPPTAFWAFTDVRDLAVAHRLAYELPTAGGERYFITSGNFSYQQVVDIILKLHPELYDLIPKLNPGPTTFEGVYHVSNEKAKLELGLTFRSLEESIRETVEGLIALQKKFA